MPNHKKPTRIMTRAILNSIKNLEGAGRKISLLDEDVEATLHSDAIDGDERVLALALMERGDVKEALTELLVDLIYNVHNVLGDTDDWMDRVDKRGGSWWMSAGSR
jgi:hypothetical protein